MTETPCLMDADGGFVTDERGHLVPSAPHQRALDAQTRNLASVSAAAEMTLLQQRAAGGGYDMASIDAYLGR